MNQNPKRFSNLIQEERNTKSNNKLARAHTDWSIDA